jgi:hypothetical protein
MDHPPLASRQEIEVLFAAVAAAMDELLRSARHDDPGGPASYAERREAASGLAEALRFCCVAAQDLGDPALLPLIREAVERGQRFDPDACDDRTAMGQGLTRLLRAGAPADKEISEIARSKDPRLRFAVAAGLRPRGPAERALLEELAADTAVHVRDAAKKTLVEVGEVPWWKGKFESDPAARLLPDEVERVKPALVRVSELLDQPRYKLVGVRGDPGPLLAELALLPDELAVEVLRKLCGPFDAHAASFAGPLLVHLLSREGGVDAFDRLLARWAEDEPTAVLAKETIVAAAREPGGAVRRELCELLLQRAAGQPAVDRLSGYANPARLAAEVVASAWPPGEDISPVFEVILRLAGEQLELELNGRLKDAIVEALASILTNEEADARLVIPRALEARILGYPKEYSLFSSAADTLLSRLDREPLRAAAERAVDSEDEGTVRWGLTRLLEEAFDEARDGDPIDRVRGFFAHPRLRGAILADHGLSLRALCPTREALRRGELEYPVAVALFERIGSVFGGVTHRSPAVLADPSMRLTREELEEHRRGQREELEGWLGPEKCQGPPTAEEWERLREARGRHGFESLREEVRLWGTALEEGPFSAVERRDLDRFLEAFRGGATEIGRLLATAMTCKEDPAVAAELKELVDKLGIRPVLEDDGDLG